MSRELQSINQQNKLAQLARQILECKSGSQNVTVWCKMNGIYEHTYYRWQKRLYELAQAQQEIHLQRLLQYCRFALEMRQ